DIIGQAKLRKKLPGDLRVHVPLKPLDVALAREQLVFLKTDSHDPLVNFRRKTSQRFAVQDHLVFVFLLRIEKERKKAGFTRAAQAKYEYPFPRGDDKFLFQ